MATPPIPPERASSLTGPSTGKSTSTKPSTGPAIPVRSSSTRKKPPSQLGDAKRSRGQLEHEVQSLDEDISKRTKKLKPSTSYDSNFWTANAEINRLCQQRAGMQSQLSFLDYKESSRTDVSEDDWQANEQAQNLDRQIHAYRQAEEIAKKQANRLENNRTGLSALFFKLFATSPQGLGLPTGAGRRETSDQSRMRAEMIKKYCPDAPKENVLWNPISGTWVLATSMKAAHLYAWRQADSMDAIFGDGAKADIFSPCNGLFLPHDVEQALDRGYVAIVPDVNLEVTDSKLPLKGMEQRSQALKDWERAPVKDYKVVVLAPEPKFMQATGWQDETGDIRPMVELDGKPLKFLTDFRPRARYVWWTFMNAVLQTAWRQKHDESNLIRLEVQKATRLWGTRGRYIKKNMLRGFVDELGHDIDSILSNSVEGDDEFGEFGEAGTADNADADPGAVAVIASETIFRTREAARDEDEDDEDEDEDDEDDEDESW